MTVIITTGKRSQSIKQSVSARTFLPAHCVGPLPPDTHPAMPVRVPPFLAPALPANRAAFTLILCTLVSQVTETGAVVVAVDSAVHEVGGAGTGAGAGGTTTEAEGGATAEEQEDGGTAEVGVAVTRAVTKVVTRNKAATTSQVRRLLPEILKIILLRAEFDFQISLVCYFSLLQNSPKRT